MNSGRIFGASLLIVAALVTAYAAESETRTSGLIAVTRSPYLMLGTPTSITIRWRTDIPADSVVRYGSSVANLTETFANATATTEHVVAITGLLPSTRYYYSIGTSAETLEGGASDYYFETSKGPKEPLRIWAVGDFGTGNTRQRDVRDRYYEDAGSLQTDVWLQLGDNAYSDGTDAEYQSKNFDVYDELYRHTVTWPTLGNHDGHSADSATESGVYYDIFTLPRAGEAGGLASGTEAYYSFDNGNVHFVCLDSYDTDRSTGGAMLTWLENDLAETSQDWIIAYWHHPPYSKGSHNSDTESRLIDMRTNAVPILEDYGVDLVLGGHSHVYERTFLIGGHYGLSTTWNAATHLVDGGNGRTDGDGAYVKPSTPASQDGAIYITAGSGGALSSSFGLDHPAHFYAVRELGSIVIDVLGDTMEVKFLRETGTIDDYFTLSKNIGGGVFSKLPVGGVKEQGDSHTFEAELSNPVGAVAYQWTKDGVNVGPDSGSFTIASLSITDSGVYACSITDESKATYTTPSATLTIVEELSATGPVALLLGTIVLLFSGATFAISARIG